MDLTLIEELRSKLNLAQMGKPALIGIAVILVVVAVAAGRLLIGTATANEFTIARNQESASQEAAEPDGEATVFVHVAGAVVRPGLCELPAGARVADAVQAAGGFTEDAAVESCNLARAVQDGEQIIVSSESDLQAPASDQAAAAGFGAPAASGAAGGLVNINTANAAELETLPGIGSATAQKIVAYRTANGSFKSKDEITKVSGIGDKKYEAISELICI